MRSAAVYFVMELLKGMDLSAIIADRAQQAEGKKGRPLAEPLKKKNFRRRRSIDLMINTSERLLPFSLPSTGSSPTNTGYRTSSRMRERGEGRGEGGEREREGVVAC